MSDVHPFIDQHIAPEAESHLSALVEYWGADTALVPAVVFKHPSMGPSQAQSHLEALQRLLTPAQYAALPGEIVERAVLPTREARLAKHAQDLEHRREAHRLARLSEERAAIAARDRERLARLNAERAAIVALERAERQRMVRLRQDQALQQLEYVLRQRPWAVTDAFLESLTASDERGPIIGRVREEVMRWFRDRKSPVQLAEPDEAQVDVVRTTGTNLLVRARAGSGKTRALIYRAIFLAEKGGCAPDELLLVAFNKKAADQIGDRLAQAGAPFPHVLTLHALARAISGTSTDIVVDDGDEPAVAGALSGLISEIVSRMMDDPDTRPKVRELMLGIAKGLLDTLEDSGLMRQADDGLRWRRALAIEALDGTRTRSEDDKRVLDFLFEHDVRCRYRKAHWVCRSQVKPLATLRPEHGHIVIDLAPYALSADAVAALEEKGFRIVRLRPLNGGDPKHVEAEWARALREVGVTLRRLSPDQLWERLRERARRTFNRLMQQYVSRMRAQALSDSQRLALHCAHEPSSELERLFLELADRAYTSYVAELARSKRTDFPAVLLAATRAVEAGRRTWRRGGASGDIGRLKHLMVDEFQDMSPLLMGFLRAIHAANPMIQVTGIGDDWQAIYGFAGAHKRFFDGFPTHFSRAVHRLLPTNYRSEAGIVEVGNAIMKGRGAEAVANRRGEGERLIGDIGKFELAPTEQGDKIGSRLLAAVRRLVADALRSGGTVAVLSRRRSPIPEKMLEDEDGGWEAAVHAGLDANERARVEVSTVHRYKGREAQTVILADASHASFPIILPTWRLFRIFGDTIESLIEDERRLLYVAATRAKDRLICLYERDESSGLSPLFGESAQWFENIDWSDFAPVSVLSEASCVITVGNAGRSNGLDEGTLAIKELLRADGYRYGKEPDPHWSRILRVPDGGVAELRRSLEKAQWARAGRALLVTIEQAGDAPLSRFFVSQGNWTPY